MAAARWDLTALLNAADPKAATVERHLWLVRLLEWVREPGPQAASGGASITTRSQDSRRCCSARTR